MYSHFYYLSNADHYFHCTFNSYFIPDILVQLFHSTQHNSKVWLANYLKFSLSKQMSNIVQLEKVKNRIKIKDTVHTFLSYTLKIKMGKSNNCSHNLAHFVLCYFPWSFHELGHRPISTTPEKQGDSDKE